MASESKESTNLVRLFFCYLLIPVSTHLGPEGQASRTTLDKRRGNLSFRAQTARPRAFQHFSAHPAFHSTTARAGPGSATYDDDDRDDN